MSEAIPYTKMTEAVHAGYRVPPSHLTEVPIETYDSSPSYHPMQRGRPVIHCQRKFDVESYWSFLFRYRWAVVAAMLCAVLVIIFVSTTTYLAAISARNYTMVEVERIMETDLEPSKYPMRNEINSPIFDEPSIYDVQQQLSPAMLAALRTEPVNDAGLSYDRRKRQTNEDAEACRKRHENCQTVLHQMQEITKNVTEQINRLHNLMRQIRVSNNTMFPFQNNTIIEFVKCLECKELEDQNAMISRNSPNSVTDLSENHADTEKDDRFKSIIQNAYSAVTEISPNSVVPNDKTSSDVDFLDNATKHPASSSIQEDATKHDETARKNEISNPNPQPGNSPIITSNNNPTLEDTDNNNDSEFDRILGKFFTGEDELPELLGGRDPTLENRPSDQTENRDVPLSKTADDRRVLDPVTSVVKDLISATEAYGSNLPNRFDSSTPLEPVKQETTKDAGFITWPDQRDLIEPRDSSLPNAKAMQASRQQTPVTEIILVSSTTPDLGETLRQTTVNDKDSGSHPLLEQANDGTDSFVQTVKSVETTEENTHTTAMILTGLTTPDPGVASESRTTDFVDDRTYRDQGQSKINQDFFMPTAETMKTSKQLTVTPGMTLMPYPVCFYTPPNAPPQNFRQTSPGSITFPVTFPGSAMPIAQQMPHAQTFVPQAPFRQQLNPYIAPQPMPSMMQPMMQTMMQPMQFQYTPMQFHPTSVPVAPQHVGPTGPGKSYFPANPSAGQAFTTATGQAYMPYYCTYVPTPAFQFPAVQNVAEFQRAVSDKDESQTNKGNLEAAGSRSREYPILCPSGTKACYDDTRCVPRTRWCDGTVDCMDASDEFHCSCRDRVERDRLCDGYFDCPQGQDELGCFGCDKYSFSCFESKMQTSWGNCVPLVKRCDGFPDCPNGKDEANCNVITHSVDERDTFAVGYTQGYLYRNWQGKWYPSCTPSETWASDACSAEIGEDNIREAPEIRSAYLPQHYNGPYIIQLPSTEIKIVETCYNNSIFVVCPPIPCGTRVLHQRNIPPFDPWQNAPRSQSPDASNLKDNYKTDSVARKENDIGHDLLRISRSANEATNETDSKDPILGIVGGRLSEPKAWPSLAAIYKNGKLHCGGVILAEVWILTAAHCVDGYKDNYYDVAAGILRRFSHSPMEQNRKVSFIVIHPAYESEIMKNDVALIRLEREFYFNQWVRPACLPEMTTAGPHWRTGPLAETTCMIAGWGATKESGSDPDQMREVELPILPNCKHLFDRNDAEICAGLPQGGRDACQGDSGGPLMCRNPNSPRQWYVAGIVSHGEGCARPNEPGAYTKVGQFVDWIERMMLLPGRPHQRPLQVCPGFYCSSGSGRCYPAQKRCDRLVDCLEAEDETNCPYDHRMAFRNYPTSEDNSSTTLLASSSSETTTTSDPSDLTTATTEENNFGTTTVSFETDTTTIGSSSTTTTDIVTTDASTTETSDSVAVTESSMERNGTLPPAAGLSPPPIRSLTHFTCTILIQTLDANKRCDKTIDCEDGTDEIGCSCKDYLANLHPNSICDGHVDCLDKSDEENCNKCSPEEFHCKKNGECIPLSKRCDGNMDCSFNEDETNCLTLTNAEYVALDLDDEPHQNREGLVTSYKNETWELFCLTDEQLPETDSLAGKLCSYLGFGTYEEFHVTKVLERSLEVRRSTAAKIIPYEYRPTVSLPTEEKPTCDGLYLRCRPTITKEPATYQVVNSAVEHDNDTYLWPWYTAVFVDGGYRCSAVLLSPDWLLTDSACVNNVRLAENYTVALLGLSRSYLHVDGPHQQLIPVVDMKEVKRSDALLLRLQEPANITRHVQPIYLEKKISSIDEARTCVTQGLDNNGETKTVFLHPETHDCPECHRCYQYDDNEKCQNNTMPPWIGTVVCLGNEGWHPAAVYYSENGPCNLKKPLTSINYIGPALNAEMEKPVQLSPKPRCAGFRCPLGECIDQTKICDGIPHCRDGSDENADHCERMNFICTNSVHESDGCRCAQSELRCSSGKCVPKSAFCDGQVDCDDGSDEPVNCTCAAYLKLTSPKLVCDGRRHCLDKSDESSEECPCTEASFRCEDGSKKCVPKDFLCDGYQDCPSGEDEKVCLALKPLSTDPAGSGEVIGRSYGVWHTQCFSAEGISQKEARDLCVNARYAGVGNITMLEGNETKTAATIPILDNFYMVRLNRQTWIVMRDDKPLVRLQSPRDKCHRAHVTCE